MPAVQPGAQNPTKPVTFDEEEIAALAAYVASLGPGPAIPDPSDYSLAGLSEEERQEAVSRGGQIFLTNCTACHNFAGKGGAMPHGGYAPDLSNTEAQQIYEAMLTGPGQMDSFSNGNLSPEEKRDVIAYLYSLREQPALRRLRPRRHGPGERGPVRLGRGHRRAGRLRDLDRRPHRSFLEARRTGRRPRHDRRPHPPS